MATSYRASQTWLPQVKRMSRQKKILILPHTLRLAPPTHTHALFFPTLFNVVAFSFHVTIMKVASVHHQNKDSQTSSYQRMETIPQQSPVGENMNLGGLYSLYQNNTSAFPFCSSPIGTSKNQKVWHPAVGRACICVCVSIDTTKN